MAFTLDKFVISFLIFGFAITSVLFVFSDVVVKYELNASTSKFNNTYAVINESYDLDTEIRGDMVNGTILGTDESWTSMIKNAYKSIRRTITTPFALVFTISSGIMEELGLPGWIGTFLILTISFAVLFALIYLLFRAG